MRRSLAFVFLAGILALGGCAETQSFLSDPKTTVAIGNAERIVTAVACGVSSAAQTAQGVESQLGSAGQTVTGIVYVGSAAACKFIGGYAQGTAAVPASVVTAVAP